MDRDLADLVAAQAEELKFRVRVAPNVGGWVVRARDPEGINEYVLTLAAHDSGAIHVGASVHPVGSPGFRTKLGTYKVGGPRSSSSTS